ncbi:MAG: AMP-binding protein, partial [Bacteroidota bacterium]
MIHTAPSDNPATPYLGRTIPDLLDEACANYPNATAFNQPAGDGWSTMSNDAFRTASDEIALGLLDLDLSAGDRVAFFMRSDLHFSLADMGCQIASLINVPIYLSNAIEVSTYVLQHSGSKALIVSDVELLANVADALADVPAITNIVVAEGDATQAERLGLPSGVNVHAMDALRERGRAVLAAHPERPKELREAIDEKSLATIIYTSGTTGRPKGVMLTHENISFNGITAVNSLPEIGNGPQERVLTFLPMTHIFARTLNYVAIAKGHSLFYTSIDDLGDNLKTVKPTMFASVPRVIEKVYDKIMLA